MNYATYLKEKELAKGRNYYPIEHEETTHWFTKSELKGFLDELKNDKDNQIFQVPLIKNRIEHHTIYIIK